MLEKSLEEWREKLEIVQNRCMVVVRCNFQIHACHATSDLKPHEMRKMAHFMTVFLKCANQANHK